MDRQEGIVTATLPGLKPVIRRNPATLRWDINCPCGYVWHTNHHRLALLLATNHNHQAAQ